MDRRQENRRTECKSLRVADQYHQPRKKSEAETGSARICSPFYQGREPMILELAIVHCENLTAAKHNERLRIAGQWRSNSTWEGQKNHAASKKLARRFCHLVNTHSITVNSTYQEEFELIGGYFWWWRLRWMSRDSIEAMIRFLHQLVFNLI